MSNKWKDDYYVKAFQLAGEGLSDPQLAKAFGVPSLVFKEWMKAKPALRRGLEKARGAKGEGGKGFRAFVYDRLPRRARDLWDELESIDQIHDPRGKRAKKAEVFRLIDLNTSRTKQHIFIQALVKYNFMSSIACQMTGIGTSEVDKWKRESPPFRDLMEGLIEHKRDFFESALIDLVRSGDSAATIFANRTMNRLRGYNDKVVIETDSTVTHKHQLNLDDIPVEARRAILEALRSKQLQLEDKSNAVDAEIVE